MNEHKSAPKELLDIIAVRYSVNVSTPPKLLVELADCSVGCRAKIFYSNNGSPVGYIVWASLNKESFILLSKTKKMPAYTYEWCEGRLIVVHDVVVLPQWNSVVNTAIRDFLTQKRFVAFLRRGRLHVWSKPNGRFKRTIL